MIPFLHKKLSHTCWIVTVSSHSNLSILVSLCKVCFLVEQMKKNVINTIKWKLTVYFYFLGQLMIFKLKCTSNLHSKSTTKHFLEVIKTHAKDYICLSNQKGRQPPQLKVLFPKCDFKINFHQIKHVNLPPLPECKY